MLGAETSAVIIFFYVLNEQEQDVVQILRDPFGTASLDRVLYEIEKPAQFSSQQLRIATDNFSHLLGSGGFGAVYRGNLLGSLVAVKVLNESSDKKNQDLFLAEVRTIGKTNHINLVKLYGFCFDRDLRALVYEFVGNSSLDRLLFQKDNKSIEWDTLHSIAIGTAKGIECLHEDCQQRIIHYDIKPENILLDVKFCPKIADFGLAKLSNREKTHITLTGSRGTPGYGAPEMWMPFPITHKCDIYSFIMLLFEILGRRRNMDVNVPESQEWFPRWVWKKLEKGEFQDLIIDSRIEEKDKEKAERTALVALWCVQYKPARPGTSVVVKILEGGVEIPTPKNPFSSLDDGIFFHGDSQSPKI